MSEPKQVTKGNDFTVGSFSWSPNGKQIAFSAQLDPDLGSDKTSDIYVLNLADSASRKVVVTKGPDSHPIWSPDGKQIAYETSNGRDFFYYSNSYIAVVSTDGGSPRILTEAFDENPSLLEWSNHGILFSASEKTSAHLFRADPSTKKIERLSGPDSFVASQFSFTSDFRQCAFIGAYPNRFSEVYVATLNSFAPKQLTTMSNQLKGFKLAIREVVGWKSTDGTPIEGCFSNLRILTLQRYTPYLSLSTVDRRALTDRSSRPTDPIQSSGSWQEVVSCCVRTIADPRDTEKSSAHLMSAILV
jgi:dipeptidyl aminopeptidase/acylaminoacyl peptidase